MCVCEGIKYKQILENVLYYAMAYCDKIHISH